VTKVRYLNRYDIENTSDDVSAMADSENSKKGGAADVPDDPELAEKRALVAALGREEREDGL